MTVKELIEELQAFPHQNFQIYVTCPDENLTLNIDSLFGDHPMHSNYGHDLRLFCVGGDTPELDW